MSAEYERVESDGSGAGSRELRVLIVDDDAGARALHGRFVAGIRGFSVISAVGTGRAAIERGLRGDIDLVLLDMRLPDVSGVEVLHQLRTLGAASPDVLVISSSHDRVTVRQALAARVVGYLVKPFTRESLEQRLGSYRAEKEVTLGDAVAEHAGAEVVPQEVPLAQGEIDRLLTTGRIGLPGGAGAALRSAAPETKIADLPKGVAEVTLAKVLAVLDPVAARSAGDVSAQCGIGRATARRYLDYLVDTGVIDIAHRYGKRGRPEVLYRLAQAPTP